VKQLQIIAVATITGFADGKRRTEAPRAIPRHTANQDTR